METSKHISQVFWSSRMRTAIHCLSEGRGATLTPLRTDSPDRPFPLDTVIGRLRAQLTLRHWLAVLIKTAGLSSS